MHNVTTSRHIRTSSELMIMVPIKNDFVPITELVMTYAARISLVLQALAELRQLKVERGFDNPVGPIERLQMIYRVQWTVIEPFDDVTTSERAVTRQLHTPQVVLTSHFDNTWEQYFQDLVTTGGPLLDLIFSHCQDYEGYSCKDGYEAFASFIRRHQRRCDFLYATAPEVTIGDVRYFTRLSTNLLGSVPGTLQALPQVEAEAGAIIREQFKVREHGERTRAALRAVHGLYDLGKRLFLDAGGIETGHKPRNDRKLFDDAVASTLVLEPDLYRLATALEARRLSDKPIAAELHEAAEWVQQIVHSGEVPPIKPPDPRVPPAPAKTPLEAAAASLPALELTAKETQDMLQDVQGNILSSFPRAEDAKLVLVRCQNSAGLRRLLAWAGENFSSELDSRTASEHTRMTVALSYHGLKLLELPHDVLEQFPRELREGMEERAGLLGDVSENHPKHWKLPCYPDGRERVHLSTVHVAFVIHGSATQIVEAIRALERHNPQGEIIHTLPLDPGQPPELSQPLPPVELLQPKDAKFSALDVQALGEFILGYKNRVGDVAACVARAAPVRGGAKPIEGESLFKNGSFVAMRKMRKDDAGMQRYIERLTQQIVRNDEPTAHERAEIAADVEALIIGRRADGKMLGSLQPKCPDTPNAFDFSSDPKGISCPFHSHVRRTNPRDGKSPRIARRGIHYRPDRDGVEANETGLLFMAYCANLAGQYETVQRWVNGGNSTGILSRQNDLLCGAPGDSFYPRIVSLASTAAARLPNAPREIILPLPEAPFVSLRWGMYFFVPSRSALEQLAAFEPLTHVADPAAVGRGKQRLAELEQLPPALRTHEWRRLLEEVPEAESPQAQHARDVAAAITDAGGAFQFQGVVGPKDAARPVDVVVVTTVALARKVLSTSDEFSVQRYRERLQHALEDHYLGYDIASKDEATGLTYEDVSTVANDLFRQLASQAHEAGEYSDALLQEPETLQLDPDGVGAPGLGQRNSVAVRDLATAVIGKLCHRWLDMPAQGRASAANPATADNTRGWMNAVERLLIASRYCFQAMPVPLLAAKAAANQAGIHADYYSFEQPESAIGRKIKQLFEDVLPPSEADRLMRTVLLGAVGFAPPAVGAVTRILDYWIESEQLWQIQRMWRTDKTSLQKQIFEALGKVPAPPTLYRTATAQASALGPVTHVAKDTIVIINLAAVYEDAVRNEEPNPAQWFFGGDHGGARGAGTQHGCPGQGAGIAAIEHIISALLACKNLRRERRMLLSYDRTTA